VKRTSIVAGLVAIAVLGWAIAPEQNAQPAATPAKNSEESAIRASVDAFAAAFNKHDAKAIGNLFLPDAYAVTEEGDLLEGREAIAQEFADLFEENPQAKMEVSIDLIKFVGSDLAFEFGTTRMTPGPGQSPELSRYTVVHVKRNGQWSMALARDTDVDALTSHDQLEQLGWLVGEWIDESPDAVVMTSCRWSPDGNYLLQDIEVKRAGKTAMTISQRIGYDSVRKCIRSWAFDSLGGFVESNWTRTDDAWVIKATGVSNEREDCSATNRIERTGPDSFVWRSTDRLVGGDVAEPLEVRVVRRPPQASDKK
jgi:uncharacterized protein (TIGR02246 family)